MKEVIKRVFVADDGTEFNDAEACKIYELDTEVKRRVNSRLVEFGDYMIDECGQEVVYLNDLPDFIVSNLDIIRACVAVK